jgi:hypothetical protein
MISAPLGEVFHPVLIKPSHYDADGFPIRWLRLSRRRTSLLWFYSCIAFEKIHPLDGGFLRLKSRRERRPSLLLESPLTVYPRTHCNQARLLTLVLKLRRVGKHIKRNAGFREYTDLALTPR